ncbi:MAG: YceI family protein [Gammaproteobacteria bacterium]|nr:YceI family protein [Gammaproteobacteria bacterium]MBT5222370.1 YceI family protein [Gammaproteobacteria bacterium]MBT5826128.1 YceI family protein [Gammaproteobacteria bacterium]MBT5965720.1 YceI family protein [Gammaproteobacteria bacterium]MBT6420627.1 YceI family protein [Gammaproteobacteria bacterium]
MKRMVFLSLLLLSNIAVAKLSFVTTTHPGQWELNNKASTLNFTTTKNSSKTEIQSFKKFEGHIYDTKVSMTIDLGSVNTGIEIRDQRIKELFFDIVKFPTATVTIDLRKSDLKQMKIGQTKTLREQATIEIQGVKQTLPVELQVTSLNHNKLMVFSRKPVIIYLKNFDLLNGVIALREIAELKSINTAVPVTFSLVFSHQ